MSCSQSGESGQSAERPESPAASHKMPAYVSASFASLICFLYGGLLPPHGFVHSLSNCHGIRDSTKRAGLVQWLRSLAVVADVICLQETHCSSASECSSWFASSGLSCVLSPGSTRSCGCVILYRPCLSLVHSHCDSDGHFLQCEYLLRGHTFRVACLCAKS